MGKIMSAVQFLDILRRSFDGGNHFIFRVYRERDKSFTVEEFLKLPRQSFGPGWVVVCRDGFGWSLSHTGEVYGFPVPWNVPGPGECISSSLLQQVGKILDLRYTEGPEGISEKLLKEETKYILALLKE